MVKQVKTCSSSSLQEKMTSLLVIYKKGQKDAFC